MKKVIEILQEELSAAFEKAGYDKKYAKVGVSNRPDLCQYQCNGALAAAKEYHKAPIQMANEVVEFLKDSESFKEIAAQAPGFINMSVSDRFLADYINKMAASETLGLDKAENPETIVIDYGGANVAKPLHVNRMLAERAFCRACILLLELFISPSAALPRPGQRPMHPFSTLQLRMPVQRSKDTVLQKIPFPAPSENIR